MFSRQRCFSQEDELSVERSVPEWGTQCLRELHLNFALSKSQQEGNRILIGRKSALQLMQKRQNHYCEGISLGMGVLTES